MTLVNAYLCPTVDGASLSRQTLSCTVNQKGARENVSKSKSVYLPVSVNSKYGSATFLGGNCGDIALGLNTGTLFWDLCQVFIYLKYTLHSVSKCSAGQGAKVM